MIFGDTFIEVQPLRQPTKTNRISHEKKTRKKLIHSAVAPSLSINPSK